MKKYYFLFIALTAMIYTSCSKLVDPTPETPDPLKEINLTDTLSMYAGNVININYTITPASYDTTKLVWASSDTSIIAVTNSGKISAKKVGISTISVSNLAKTVSVSCAVTVKDSLSVGLLAYYPFNSSAADFTGHGYNGTTNNVTLVANRFGVANSAYYFDGLTSFIEVADKPELRLNNTDFTLNTWVKLEDYNTSFGSAILLKRISDVNNGWNLSVRGYGGSPEGRVSFGQGGGSVMGFSNTIIGLSNWTMISCVYKLSDQKLKIYVNGLLDKTVDNLSTPNAFVTSSLYIGKDEPSILSNGYFFKGIIDDIRIYNRKLNENEITKLYNLTY